jgi:hypothetical protein
MMVINLLLEMSVAVGQGINIKRGCVMPPGPNQTSITKL